jgi:glycine/D-amino acid oxidase-like deaminating enzyme
MPSRNAVIIGAGISGVLTSLELIQLGWSVTLLDAAHVGAGSSSRTAAGIRQQFTTRETVIAMRYCVDYYQRFAKRCDEKTMVQNGYLFLVGSDQAMTEARARVAMQHAAGLTEVRALDQQQLLETFPWVNQEIAVGATFCPSDGFLLPHVIYNEGARLAEEGGVQVVRNAAVIGAAHVNGRLVGVETKKGPFEADLFLDCTNAWSPRLEQILEAAPLPIQPLKRYLWFIQRDGILSGDDLMAMPLTVTPSGLYCRPENRELLMMGKKHAAKADYAFSYEDQDAIEPSFSHKTGIDSMPFELWMELAESIPAIEDFGGISATTSGYYGTTPDHNPFLGFDQQVPNLIRLVGFSGHGAMFGPFTARMAGSLAEAEADLDSIHLAGESVDLSAFKIERDFNTAEQLVI